LRRAALLALVLAALSAESASAAADDLAAQHRVWRRAYQSAVRYEHARLGRISFAIVDGTGVLRTFHGRSRYRSASLVKAMLLVSYLNRPGIRNHRLGAASRALLHPMITRSDNGAATRVLAIVGNRGLARLARRAGMTDFATAFAWGDTQMTAADQARFFLEIDKLVPRRHRRYARGLLRSIVPGQRWGIPAGLPRGARAYFKGGWRPVAGGWIVNQAALVERGRRRVALAVLTDHDRTDGYGHETIRGLTKRLLRPLARRISRK
jgi:hypothetical protein